ncbi:MAG: ABC transporter substrate-binding protein [Deltaproteobacteria bacterium]|nr:ABC transporter substrate-binding protein [Deltaproteobacteria bacterium]
MSKKTLFLSVLFISIATLVSAADVVKIGLTAPLDIKPLEERDPYWKQGLDQKRAADMALEEINAAGGINGKKVELVVVDTPSKPSESKVILEKMYNDGAIAALGGSASSVAIANGKVAKKAKKLFFGTLTYSTETTGEEAHKYIFRECYDSEMAARVLANYMNKNFKNKKYFYITADYSWGYTTEDSFRKQTGTTDKDAHRGVLTKLGTKDFTQPLNAAKESGAQVLVLVQFGRDMENSVKKAYEMGLKNSMQIIVPNLTEDMAEGGGAEAMEGVIGATPWIYKEAMKYEKGKKFVETFEKKYQRYPTTSAASAYVILWQYKEAVERAKSFDTGAIIKALEGHKYVGLKDEQQWRDWDHQSVQTVYAVKCKPASDVKASKYGLDFYEVIATMNGGEAAINKDEWVAARAKVGAPASLED